VVAIPLATTGGAYFTDAGERMEPVSFLDVDAWRATNGTIKVRPRESGPWWTVLVLHEGGVRALVWCDGVRPRLFVVPEWAKELDEHAAIYCVRQYSYYLSLIAQARDEGWDMAAPLADKILDLVAINVGPIMWTCEECSAVRFGREAMRFGIKSLDLPVVTAVPEDPFKVCSWCSAMGGPKRARERFVKRHRAEGDLPLAMVRALEARRARGRPERDGARTGGGSTNDADATPPATRKPAEEPPHG